MKYLYLILLAVACTFSYIKGSEHAANKAEALMAKHLAADAQAHAEQLERVRVIESALTDTLNDVAKAYERGKSDAEAIGAEVTDNLRAGNLRLQQHWAGCEAKRVSGATTDSGEPDAGTGDREESAGRIVRAAAQCDAQVRGLQELLIKEREVLRTGEGSSQR